MPKHGHSEEQIIAPLKEQENGEKAAEICRKRPLATQRPYQRLPAGEWRPEAVGTGASPDEATPILQTVIQ